MKYLNIIGFLVLFGWSLDAQDCETSNCNPVMTGMNFVVECIEVGENTQVTIGWAMQIGAGVGDCAAPGGSWALMVSMPSLQEYDLVSVTDTWTTGTETGSEGFDWNYIASANTVEGISNRTFVNIPPSPLNEFMGSASSGQAIITVQGQISTDCVKKGSIVNIRIASIGSVPPDTNPCPQAFNNMIGDDSVTSSLGVEPAMDLPVDLINFNAVRDGSNSLLTWETALEIDNDRYEVERSNDGIMFKSIGSVKGAGTTNIKQDYKYIDENPYRGINYYRLKQVDYDGKYVYSPIRTLTFGSDIKTDLNARYFPNPVRNALSITTDIELENHQVRLIDMQGRTLLNRGFTSGMLIHMNDMVDGIFLVEIVDANGLVVDRQRIVK